MYNIKDMTNKKHANRIPFFINAQRASKNPPTERNLDSKHTTTATMKAQARTHICKYINGLISVTNSNVNMNQDIPIGIKYLKPKNADPTTLTIINN